MLTNCQKPIYNKGDKGEILIRCGYCKKLLAVKHGELQGGYIVIQCHRCKKDNKITMDRAESN